MNMACNCENENRWFRLSPVCEYGSDSGYSSLRPLMYAVPENFLDVAYSDYYIPYEFEEGVSANKLDDGRKDAISMLYNDDQISEPSSIDTTDILVRRDGSKKWPGGSTEEIKIVIPSGIQKRLQANTGEIVRLHSPDRQFSYRTVIRALVQKIPGFYFSDYF